MKKCYSEYMITLAALCAVGAEKVLANEIRQLGYTPSGNAPGRVVFTAQEEALYRANLCLRTADRIFLSLAVFTATDFDELFESVAAVPWEEYFSKDVRVVVDKVRTFKSKLSSEHSIQSIVHKAIYSRLCGVWKMNTMPETGHEADVRVYIDKDTVSIFLDTSGEPLHRRGYRSAGGEAPIRETLASVLLHLMFWRRKMPLHDPFCGSGTIAIEAALYAYNVAPGLGRSFALENLAIYSRTMDQEIRKEAAAAIRTDCLARISGSDVDPQAIARAKANAERAGAIAGRALQTIGSDARLPRPDFTQADFKELGAPYGEGLVIANPPYGERLGDEAEASALYKSMGILFDAFPGWDMGFITSATEFEKLIGRKADHVRDLKSGNLDTHFYIWQPRMRERKERMSE